MPNVIAAEIRVTQALTRREREVLSLYCEGMRCPAIAQTLELSVRTVGDHACEVIRKLAVKDIVAAVAVSLRRGLTQTTWTTEAEGMGLSQAEERVVELRAQGLSPEQIASRLGLSKRTVEWYMSRVFDAFGVEDALHAVLEYRARRSGSRAPSLR